MPNSHSVIRELGRNWQGIILHWDFLASLLLAGVVALLNHYLSGAAKTTFDQLLAEGFSHAPGLGILALSLSIATLTFLSSLARNPTYTYAARSGALADFATFSWWEGFMALLAVIVALTYPVLGVWGAPILAGLSAYVLLGLMGLLHRFTHIVYRYAADLAVEE